MVSKRIPRIHIDPCLSALPVRFGELCFESRPNSGLLKIQKNPVKKKILKSMKIPFKSTSDFPGYISDPDSGYSDTAEHSATKDQSMSVSAEVTIFDYFS